MDLLLERDHSVVGEFLRNNPGLSRDAQAHLQAEVRWHLSQHYYAKLAAEPVLEELLRHVPDEKTGRYLAGQIPEELDHAARYRELLECYGIETQARWYGDHVRDMVICADGPAEKIFIFQVLARGVAKARLDWRLTAVHGAAIQAVDEAVRRDELRYLRRGKPMLHYCAAAGFPLRENVARRALGEMLDVCRQGRQEMLEWIFSAAGSWNMGFSTPLDRSIGRTLTRLVDQRDLLHREAV